MLIQSDLLRLKRWLEARNAETPRVRYPKDRTILSPHESITGIR